MSKKEHHDTIIKRSRTAGYAQWVFNGKCDKYVTRLQQLKEELEKPSRKATVLQTKKTKFSILQSQFKKQIEKSHKEALAELENFFELFNKRREKPQGYSIKVERWSEFIRSTQEKIDNGTTAVPAMEKVVQQLIRQKEVDLENQISKDFERLQSELGVIDDQVQTCLDENTKKISCNKILKDAWAFHGRFTELVRDHEELVKTFEKKHAEAEDKFLRKDQFRKIFEQNFRIGYKDPSNDTTANQDFEKFVKEYHQIEQERDKSLKDLKEKKNILSEEMKTKFKTELVRILEPLQAVVSSTKPSPSQKKKKK
jgi:hypothetical protein